MRTPLVGAFDVPSQWQNDQTYDERLNDLTLTMRRYNLIVEALAEYDRLKEQDDPQVRSVGFLGWVQLALEEAGFPKLSKAEITSLGWNDLKGLRAK